jgi:hypothetical protein
LPRRPNPRQASSSSSCWLIVSIRTWSRPRKAWSLIHHSALRGSCWASGTGSPSTSSTSSSFPLMRSLPSLVVRSGHLPPRARGPSTGGGRRWFRWRTTWVRVVRWWFLCASSPGLRHWVGRLGGAWACLLGQADRVQPRGHLWVIGVSPARDSAPDFLPDMEAVGYPCPCVATRPEGGRLAFYGGSTILPLHHGSPSISGGTSFDPRCGSDHGSSSRLVASVGRGSPVRTAEPRSGCVQGLLLAELVKDRYGEPERGGVNGSR